MPTLDEQIADLDAAILTATKARSVRTGDKSVERQDLEALRSLRAELIQRRNSRAGSRAPQTFIEMGDE